MLTDRELYAVDASWRDDDIGAGASSGRQRPKGGVKRFGICQDFFTYQSKSISIYILHNARRE